MISPDPINITQLLAQAHHPGAGAIVLFSGEARNLNEGKQVEWLEYEAFVPLAEKMIGEILEKASKQWDLKFASCVHRIGKVGISEPAVCVITASPHLKEAYAANQYIIHRVKYEVPIWKKEAFADGTTLWGKNHDSRDPNQEEFNLNAP